MLELKIFKPLHCVAAALIVLGGCTAYQLSGRSKSVAVESISPNTFTVNFCGNAYMSQAEVEKYALQRASEEALSKGCSHFIVLKKRDDSQFCAYNPKRGIESSSAMPTAVTPAYETSPFMKPNITLTLQCLS